MTRKTCKKLCTLAIDNRTHWLYRFKGLGRSRAPYLNSKSKVVDMTCSELRTVVTRSHRKHQEFSAPDDDMQLGGLQFAEIDGRDMERYKEDYPKFTHMKLLPGGNRILAIVKRELPYSAEDWSIYKIRRVELWNIEGIPHPIWTQKRGRVANFACHSESDDVFTLFFNALIG